MERPIFKFEELKVYQKSLNFVDDVYSLITSFPKNETYGLSSQFKRASVSIALNIAEGAGDTNAQFNRYLQIAQDSIKECVVCATIAKRQKYISKDVDNDYRKKLLEIAKMITNLQKYLKNNSFKDQRPKTKDQRPKTKWIFLNISNS